MVTSQSIKSIVTSYLFILICTKDNKGVFREQLVEISRFCHVVLSVIIQRVRNKETPQFRPHVSRIQENESVFDLMEICWEEQAYFRPPFNIICDSLKEIRVALGTYVQLSEPPSQVYAV